MLVNLAHLEYATACFFLSQKGQKSRPGLGRLGNSGQSLIACKELVTTQYFSSSSETRQRPERGEPLRKALGQHVRRRMIILLDPDTKRAQPSATSSASAARVRYLRLYSSTCGILDRSDLNQHR